MADRSPRALGGIVPYDGSWLRSDVIAGVSAGAVVIPQAMGYATVAGLPVEIGLYTCIFPLAIYAFLGGSRRLSFSTTSTIVALTGLGLSSVGADSGAEAISTVATLTAMVGLALLLFRVVRLGWMVETVSAAVVEGLKVGVGLTIIADQLPKLLGIPGIEGGFIADIGNAITQIGNSNTATVVLSLATIGGLLALKTLAPRVPGPLLAVAGGILLVAFGGLTDRGVEVIAQVPTGLPLPVVPNLDHFLGLLPFAFAIAFMSYFESITAARIARKPGDGRLDNDHEYVAVGLASLVGSFFQTVPPAGGFSQTQVNTSAGAQTQVSQMVTAVLAILVALFLAPILSDLPEATLGSVVTVSVLGLVSLAALSRLAAISRLELVIAVITAVIALVFDLLVGVIVGVFLTFYFVLRTLNHPVVTELRRPVGSSELLPARRGDQPIPGLLAIRVESGMYTMNIRRVQDEVYRIFEQTDPFPRVVLLDAVAIVDTSVTVIDVWREIADHLADHGATLWVAALPDPAMAKLLRTPNFGGWIDEGRVHPSVTSAVAAFESAQD